VPKPLLCLRLLCLRLLSSRLLSLRLLSTLLVAAIAGCATPPPLPDTPPRFDPTSPDNAFPQSAYPAPSLRLWEEGDVIISVLVLADGKVGDVRVAKSSGFQRLDDAAMNWYREHGRFLPAVQGGKRVAQWKTLRVVFKIKNNDQPPAL
jgi:protein TonB